MPSLLELQKAFAQALLIGESAQIERLVVANGIDPAARLRIYSNNARENFLASLRAAFPVVERLVGADYFCQMACEYQQRHPSPSGNLHHVGESLSLFLRRFEGTQYSYLPDVARLEWACQEVRVAADHAPFDPERLRDVPVEKCPAVVFELHPAARIVSSPFPVLRIWRANQPDGDASEEIALASGGQSVLILRATQGDERAAETPDHVVELHPLDDEALAFLEGVARGENLGALSARPADTDIGVLLRRYVGAGALVDFTLPN